MNPQLLASISHSRHITHEAGQIVHLNWDSQQFSLQRPSFVQFVRTLESGYKSQFAEDDDYSVVQVDDDVRDVWIENSCISVNRAEYRALLDAALRTETRLHGFRVTDLSDERDYRRFTLYRLPRPTRPNWN